ncbi:MAG: Bug family tripartite tricarboxylate transporter substrate binding protein [Burkholderiales bacterium]
MNRLVHARQLLRRAALGVLLAIAGAGSAIAQADFPSRPLRIIVPQPPGGGFDFVGRTLADALGRQLAQSVVVDNRTGSGTLVGTDAAAKSTPDGYTLLVGSVSNLVLNPALYATLPYDSVRDFEPLGVAVTYSYTLMARKDLAVTSLADLVQQARAKPGGFSYASAGNGSGQHVLAAALWHLAGVELVHVPYRGAQAAYQDLLGGRVDLFFDLAPTARAQIAVGTVKALATSGAQRDAMHPELPTLRESGVADLELESWFGLFAPARTPAAALERLRSELARAAASPEVQAVFARAGGRPLPLTAEQTRARLARDLDRWTPLLRASGIKAD